MRTINMHQTRRIPFLAFLASLAMLAMLATGCGSKQPEVASFATPEDAVKALVAALETDDTTALARLLGPGSESLLSSGDPVADKQDRAGFLASYKAKNSLAPDGDKVTLVVGENDWPMPIPLVKHDGKWHWDGAAGADELVYRRVGANELGTIDVMRGFVSAQIEYASVGRDGDPAGIYALKLISDEGMHNGLYWAAAAGEPESPAGPFVAEAAAEGYRASKDRQPYHGYFYRLLYAQGANANGGARDYFKDGLMTQGFALIAWPADYGSSGVQTFVINQDGVVFQKDLGEDTATAVESIKLFDPDGAWTAIVPPAEADGAAAATRAGQASDARGGG
ncbi:MAG: DUF2950 domain-containing protein, partial [Steroidobacteraceae bacterium]